MSREPRKRRVDASKLCTGWHSRTVDHNDRQAQLPGGMYLGLSARSACVLRHDQFNRVATHQSKITVDCERPAIHDHSGLGQRQRAFGRIDKAQEVLMLRIGRKGIELHSANSQHDARRRSVQSRNGSGNIWHRLPNVLGRRLPGRAHQRGKRHVELCAGHKGVLAHLARKRVRGVNDMARSRVTQVAFEPLNAAKSAHTHRQWLPFGPVHTPGQRERRGYTGLGHSVAKSGRLSGSTQDQKVRCDG